MEIELKAASKYERKIFYKEEWDIDDVPDFIMDSLSSREFGFDHYGQGPNDRYKTFIDRARLKRFMRLKNPFAAYVSVAFYEKPEKRMGWKKSELVFDVDAKDIPIRTCDCDEGQVCDKCLNQAKDIVLMIKDVLHGDLGLKNINLVYSGRGYHVRVLDEEVMDASSELRGQIVQYVVGAKAFELLNPMDYKNLQHFIIPYGRAYKIKKNQLKDIHGQEGPGPDWYPDCVQLEDIDGLPAYTFTNRNGRPKESLKKVGVEYGLVLYRGLKETFPEMTEEEVLGYLRKCGGEMK